MLSTSLFSIGAVECPDCGKTFKDNSSMKTHQLVIHSATTTTLSALTCEKCGKSFKRKQELAVHERVHTGLSKVFLWQN